MDMDKKRTQMVTRQLKARGIKDKAVLDAFSSVRRDAFVPKALKPFAYSDSPLPIGNNQTISQPYIVARMIEALTPSENKTVLEIGTGSGYQTALLSACFARVVSVEYHESLLESAKTTLSALGRANITFVRGDGKEGYAQEGPYDAVVVSAASRKVPEALKAQLKDGGRMVIPLGGRSFQELTLVRLINGQMTHRVLEGVRFVPLL